MEFMLTIFAILFCAGSTETVKYFDEASADILENVPMTVLDVFGHVSGLGFNDMKSDPEGRYIYASDGTAVWRLDPTNKTTTLLAGSPTSRENGYVEGIGEEVRFSHIGTLTVTSIEVIVTDAWNHCLRKIDIFTNQSSPYAGTCRSRGYKDGPAHEALFNGPFGQLAHKSGLLVTDSQNAALRLVENGTVSTILSGEPFRFPNYLAEMDTLVFIINGDYERAELLSFNPENKSVEVMKSANSGRYSPVFPGTGPLVSPAPGLLLSVDANHRTILLIDFVKQNMSAICKPVEMLGGFAIYQANSHYGEDSTCAFFDPMCAVIYKDAVLIGLSNGSIVTTPLNAIVPVQACPLLSEVTREMSSCVKIVNVEIEGQHFILPEGRSVVKLKLPYGTICNMNVSVGMQDVLLTLDKDKKTALWEIKQPGSKAVSVNFPIGVHVFEVEGRSGTKCQQVVRVYDNKVVQRKVVLRVTYPLSCDNLNEVSMISINASLLHQYTDLIKACSDCALSRLPIYPDIICSSNLLTVNMNTNISISLENPDLLKTTKEDLISKLLEIQLASLKLHGRYLDITIINLNPPIVSPVTESNSLYLNPVVISTCPISGMMYNKEDDVCYFPRPTIN